MGQKQEIVVTGLFVVANISVVGARDELCSAIMIEGFEDAVCKDPASLEKGCGP